MRASRRKAARRASRRQGSECIVGIRRVEFVLEGLRLGIVKERRRKEIRRRGRSVVKISGDEGSVSVGVTITEAGRAQGLAYVDEFECDAFSIRKSGGLLGEDVFGDFGIVEAGEEDADGHGFTVGGSEVVVGAGSEFFDTGAESFDFFVEALFGAGNGDECGTGKVRGSINFSHFLRKFFIGGFLGVAVGEMFLHFSPHLGGNMREEGRDP